MEFIYEVMKTKTIQIDKGTFTDPVQYPEGIEYVLVNGETTVANGKHTGKRNGVVLRKKGTEVVK